MGNIKPQKNIVDMLREKGMNDKEIHEMFLSDIDKKEARKIIPTTKCCECKFFKNIYGVKTCGKYHSFLSNNASGCYWGEK